MLIIVCLAAYLLVLAWCILFLCGSYRLKTPQIQDNVLVKEEVFTTPYKTAESVEVKHLRRAPGYRHNNGLVSKAG